MGREVRRVPAAWVHPRGDDGRYVPMYEGEAYERRRAEWIEKLNAEGMQAAIDWYGNPPDINHYMPDWPQSERTHYMMYEDTSEGTPISPAFATPEELARWLADTGASSFGHSTASYEDWLRIAQGEWAMSDADRIASLEAEVAAKSEQLQLLHEGLVSAEAEVAALRKDAERREGVVATLQETCEIYERRLSASEPVAALATRLSAARAAHNDLLCDPKATTVQFIGSRDRLLFTWAALDSAIAAKGK